ncbi:hypothetical protein [Desulfopila inferna]|uniref:hypothetical protein n=1 Tax=Desulfopila inferna TaxID=468528 RepID=UPI001964A96C|nr:hypothetical protein [Desulfopila inferna]MBM9606210.1 hypothetical protein [Desulfopila inferna]
MTNISDISDPGDQDSSPSFTCKIIPDSDELPGSSKQWTRAKRCTLRVLDDRLIYNDTYTSYAEMEKAEIHIYQSALFFEYGILSIKAGGKTNHFGIKYSDYWKGELPFPLERIHEETPYIFLRRTLIVAIIAYILWEIIQR